MCDGMWDTDAFTDCSHGQVFYSVNSFMLEEITTISEFFPTVFTYIKFLFHRMNFFMSIIGTLTIKGFLTKVTCKMLLCSVSFLMTVTGTGSGESFCAMLTCIRLLSSVNSLVTVTGT